MLNSLPGRILSKNPTEQCDDHEDRRAVVAIQGETDSFGFETIYWCQECYDAYRNQKPVEESCVDCGQLAILSPTRDPEESGGPVRDLCSNCITKQNERLFVMCDEYEEEDGLRTLDKHEIRQALDDEATVVVSSVSPYTLKYVDRNGEMECQCDIAPIYLVVQDEEYECSARDFYDAVYGKLPDGVNSEQAVYVNYERDDEIAATFAITLTKI